MYTNYSELSSLYHHGIKGQKWGIITKKDDSETRLASEKNRLKYDEKIAKFKTDAKTSLEINKSNNKSTITLGKQELAKAFSEDSRLRAESYNERKTKQKKYETLGAAAVLAAFTLWRISAHINKTIRTVKK